MLGNPDELPTAIVYRIVAGPMVSQHLAQLAFQAVLHKLVQLSIRKAATGLQIAPSHSDSVVLVTIGLLLLAWTPGHPRA